jgi:prepilin-type N-terminal cleavage/methylation domain-containing protein
MKSIKNGFTLMELLIVIAIMGILSTIVVVAVNPARQLAKARDAERETELIAILAAVIEYASEHSGDLPDTDGDPDTSNFPSVATCIGTGAGCFNLAAAGETGEEIVPVYLVAVPTDPKFADETDPQINTGYTIYVDANGRLHASATGEIDDPITVDR